MPTLDPPIELTPHHADTVERLGVRYTADPSVLALLLAGSIAHGFATVGADVDFVAVVTPEEYRRRADAGCLTESSTVDCSYEGGYTDGKFVDVEFLRRVAHDGSEPARYAFCDARFVIDRDPSIRPLLAEVVAYPEIGVDDRIERYAAQLLAWQWYHGQAFEKRSRYLELLALQKLTLFSCRIVLAANRRLYPFHKWMLRVTADAPHRPPHRVDDLDRLLLGGGAEFVDRHVRSMIAFAGLAHDDLARRWGGCFLRDNETTWMTGARSIDDW